MGVLRGGGVSVGRGEATAVRPPTLETTTRGRTEALLMKVIVDVYNALTIVRAMSITGTYTKKRL